MGVVFLLDGPSFSLRRREKLVCQPVGHAFVGSLTCILDHPPEGKAGPTLRSNLYGHLIRRSAYAATTNFDERRNIVDRLAKDLYARFTRAFFDGVERPIDETLGNTLLAITHDGGNELGNRYVAINGVGDRDSLVGLLSAHVFVLRLYTDDLPRCTPPASKGLILGSFGAVFGTALTAVGHAGSIECTTDDVVLHTREVFYTTTANEDDGVLLEIVTFTRYVGDHLISIRKTHLSDFAQGRVGLLGCCRVHTCANTSALRIPLKRN